ncbi:putative kinase [Allocatelliglobosispora scoriae]|uniref:Putative kinase n=1 Tax=Allocatelliglobosispora scoriae TaxID=643052 RepID=A0A841C081_9ACTN|nr:AAA family ATPase [Allocatelliglobosispora scoriae]MBB5873345.1 putative kinase [Allocatelliglobosispora scoriae]
MTRLILMCGLPGTGKTTLAKQLEAAVPAVRLCPDDWLSDLDIDLFDLGKRARLEEVFWRLAQDLLRLGQSVILESGFWSRVDRDEKRLGGQALGAAVELRYLHAPMAELMRRVADRTGRGTVPLTYEQMAFYEEIFQIPDPAEQALFDAPAHLA